MTAPFLSKAARAERPAGIRFELVRDEPGFLALGRYWDSLLEQSSTCSPFLRWDWMRLWWQECRGQARLAVGVASDSEGKPLAIAPLMLSHESEPIRKHLTTLGFLCGYGPAHAERLDFIVPAGREAELTPVLCEAFHTLCLECDLVRLNSLPEESPNVPHILAALERHFVRAGVLNRTACRCISVPHTWEEVEARLSANWRGTLRRNQRGFERLKGSTVTSGSSVLHARAFEELVRLHARKFPNGVSTFITRAAGVFHQQLAERWLPAGRAQLFLLQVEGRTVASLYGFIERDEFFYYQLGWDPALAKVSPGKLALRWALQSCMQRGLKLFDLLPGEHDYKRRWSDGVRWLLDLEAYNPESWRASTFQMLRAVRRRLVPYSDPEESAS